MSYSDLDTLNLMLQEQANVLQQLFTHQNKILLAILDKLEKIEENQQKKSVDDSKSVYRVN